jgi:DNA-directed RNA polymerase subunit RPC12/RpoP
MPIRIRNLETAWVYHHDNTFDYICRRCMHKGEFVKMEIYRDGEDVWIKCPRCGVEEKITVKLKDLPFFPVTTTIPWLLLFLKLWEAESREY